MRDRYHILVVDDERNIRLTLAETLVLSGHEVELAANAEEALAILRSEGFDLMLLDLRMPGMDGLELLRRVRDIRPEMHVVILTAYGSVDDAVRAMKLGASDFVQKPFTPDEIRDVVEHTFEGPGTTSDDYEVLLAGARAAVRRDRFDAANALARRALAKAPERPEALNLIGAVLQLRGHRLEAQSFYRAAIDMEGTYEPAHENLVRSTDHERHGAPPTLGDEE